MKKCIVIDDDLYNREIASKMLESLGYQTIEAETIVEAYPYTKDKDIEAVLVDWHMPDMDGPTFIKNLRLTKHGKELMVLLYSAQESDEGIKVARDSQADGFIPKPFSLEQLTNEFRALGLA